MCRCAPAICLWLALILLPPLQAKVIAPAYLQATLGFPFILGCNVTINAKEVLKQVRWLNAQNETILHYQPQEPGSLTRHDGVELVTKQAHTSAIAIQKAKPGDEGCYTCVFDVYPTGQQQGKTCLFVVTRVESGGNKTAVGGKPTTLSCTYALPERVVQVLWRKTAEQGDTAIVASYFRYGRVEVDKPFQDRMKLSPSVGHSLLTVSSVRTEDEGCYTCDFHIYPQGSRSMTACLAVYVLPKPEVSSATIEPGVVQANCTAVSRPPAELIWNVENHNRTLGSSETSYYQQGDGTTMVVSTILLQAELLDEKQVTCTALHQGLETNISVHLNKTGNTHIVLLSVGCVVLVLLICFCVCLKKC
ncbi:OX-2 membrane glycoprotein [Pygocentrus nattereri]|uniref:Ig-like domain-containing protein n=1 Tax=Pygocentrus nattereri TaxID=42514 RepID=A0A3B4D5F4_PYGNA|nr:OX-2 membrane glycoprotein [Pygocentrus nattereri]XP_017570596.1 OX-2 membrane glycoprotein [Pygocentrus nattereri]